MPGFSLLNKLNMDLSDTVLWLAIIFKPLLTPNWKFLWQQLLHCSLTKLLLQMSFNSQSWEERLSSSKPHPTPASQCLPFSPHAYQREKIKACGVNAVTWCRFPQNSLDLVSLVCSPVSSSQVERESKTKVETRKFSCVRQQVSHEYLWAATLLAQIRFPSKPKQVQGSGTQSVYRVHFFVPFCASPDCPHAVYMGFNHKTLLVAAWWVCVLISLITSIGLYLEHTRIIVSTSTTPWLWLLDVLIPAACSLVVWYRCLSDCCWFNEICKDYLVLSS